MPSIEESKARVEADLASLRQEIDHDAILASLQAEIDDHNATDGRRSDDERQRRHGDSARQDLRFRFKRRSRSPDRERRHRHRRHEQHGSEQEVHSSRKSRQRKKERTSHYDSASNAAHPFPREPADADQPAQADPNTAFRDSLFDALADDEGAAYWESVYSQPIHVYPRPTVKTAAGQLEQMNDEDYAAYVQTKMWEKKHPHILQERQRRERRKREEEEERTRQREEFVRRRERASWEKAQRQNARSRAGSDSDDRDSQSRHEYVFDSEGRLGGASKRETDPSRDGGYREAWHAYLAAWDSLKRGSLGGKGEKMSPAQDDAGAPSRRIAWPVLGARPVTRPNIEAFMRHVPVDDQGPDNRVQLLKVERVRWHPDKIQQRFGGEVDAGTMKIVTGIFQVIDSLLEDERKRSEG